MSKTGMLAAVAAAAGLNGDQPVTLTAALLKEHFPDLAAELSAEGAAGERQRIAALEAAALPGHDKLLAAHKADGTKTAGDLALAIVAAEKQARTGMLAGLAEDEAKLKGLRSEPANGAGPVKPAHPLAGLTGEALWKAEYAVSDALKAEFPSEAAYLGFKTLDAQGRIRTTAKVQ